MIVQGGDDIKVNYDSVLTRLIPGRVNSSSLFVAVRRHSLLQSKYDAPDMVGECSSFDFDGSTKPRNVTVIIR